MTKPHLFGLTHSNRDFSLKDTWGKNQFNSSFPVALCCYMASKGIAANYFVVDKNTIRCQSIEISSLFGIEPDSEKTFFAFESVHSLFAKYVVGSLPRTDVVIQNSETGQCLVGLEIKLTALPDHTTCHLDDKFYGSEIVIRPDSIVYLACSLAQILGDKLSSQIVISKDAQKIDWTDPKQVMTIFPDISATLNNICQCSDKFQQAFLLQPVWKTEGKSPRLAENCLDVFVWSDIAFVKFILSIANLSDDCTSINRPTRTAIWLYKMLLEIVQNSKFNHRRIIDECSYNTKNDKAFASSGQITNPFMRSKRLEKPIIQKSEIKQIILGGGQDLLSPERRFDAIIYNSPELFL
ncbi:HindVP family restriction endonuclease [Actinobacillus equuli subsp. equuli]|uniref:HindVP family restriction endonuclease n=1 Tax=Actinobacillus equuli TaxID=718 RepID=UPI0024433A1B|nr:HindVP family restriction endonuclease [Actinobacillus equuli]WGE55357.1 HindVP family restriction endonuclease [Actinobacillus equuli subsp. equuli]